jgi:prepilin-type N-terminal cleavage/methylation domain-containing protein
MDTKPRGLTLVELLVVVSIITVLIGVLLPVARSAREAGRTTVCLTRLHQLATTFEVYAADHQGALPSDEQSETWDMLLDAYAGNRASFVCPSDREEVGEDDGLSYAWRDSLAVFDPKASLAGGNLYRVTRSDLLLVFEALAERHEPGFIQASTVTAATSTIDIDSFEANLAEPVW